MSETATMAAIDESRRRFGWALQRLLHALKPFMRAYAKTPEDQGRADELELDLVWVTDLDGGPGQAVLDALRANPELWSKALPEEVCIVPRRAIEKIAGQSLSDHLRVAGESIIATHAAMHRLNKE